MRRRLLLAVAVAALLTLALLGLVVRSGRTATA
ncbi:MAG: hypothetical protein V7644_499 [Actinomycetota bacterium]|jgi:hypothetical protein